MEVYMELTKKTTILFSTELYDDLASLARQRHLSVGELIREACRSQYFLTTRQERLSIVAKMAAMSLPVGTPEEIERELVPAAESIP
jgi:hypothetical protein